MYSFLSEEFNNRFKLHIVEYFERIKKILGICSFIVAIFALVAIGYYHGFYIDISQKKIIHQIVTYSLAFYALKYLILLLYSIHRKQYLRENRFQGIILGIVLIYLLVVQIIRFEIGSFENQDIENSYVLFIQFYFLFVSGVELAKSNELITKLRLGPQGLMMLSFFILIAFGTILLLLPRMTTNGTSFVDALFTSVSASTTTGLCVLSIGTDFTLRGQIIIMLLMQFGGINILTFATFFTTFFARSQGSLKQRHLIKEILSTNKISDSTKLLKDIVFATVLIELLGTMALFIYWRTTGLFASNTETLYYSLFHVISAFTNGGFTLWDDCFMNAAVVHSFVPQMIMLVIMLLGGFGFVFLQDVFSFAAIRERRKYKWKHLKTSSYIIFYTTAIIVVTGTLIFLFLEQNNSLHDKTNFIEKFMSSLFQAINASNAGLNVVDVKQISLPVLILILLLMFIGTSPGSTGGGIKTTTAFVLFKSIIATIRGKKNIEFRKRTIPFEIVDKAYSIVVMSLLLVFISVFFLAIVEPKASFLNLLFESVSAFSTCGLSMGDLSQYSNAGKLILALEMYIGRIGTLTIAFALSKRIKEVQHEYPSTYFMVG